MAREEMLKDVLRRLVEGILSDDVWNGMNWCPVCHEHPGTQATDCALVEAAEILEIDLDTGGG